MPKAPFAARDLGLPWIIASWPKSTPAISCLYKESAWPQFSHSIAERNITSGSSNFSVIRWRIQSRIGLSPTLAGMNFHCRRRISAEESQRSSPLDCRSFAIDTEPLSSTNRSATTSGICPKWTRGAEEVLCSRSTWGVNRIGPTLRKTNIRQTEGHMREQRAHWFSWRTSVNSQGYDYPFDKNVLPITDNFIDKYHSGSGTKTKKLREMPPFCPM
jgi:hypothetical protein